MNDTSPRPVLDAEWISDQAIRTPGRALWWGMSAKLATRLALIVVAAALVAAAWWWLTPAGDPVRVPAGLLELADVPPLGGGAAAPTGESATGGRGAETGEPGTGDPVVFVHVAGAVAEPGLLSVPDGTRVGDVLTTAGGPTPDADLNAVNLAAVVVDGQQIYVPTLDENVPPARVGGDPAGGGTAEGPVNLNTATAAVLETLPGIGPVTAERIVSDRADNGPYTQVGDLQRIAGIGPALVGALEGKVTT